MNPILEVVTYQNAAPGVIAHARGGVLYVHAQYPGMTVAQEAAFPRCKPVSRWQDAPQGMRAYSAGSFASDLAPGMTALYHCDGSFAGGTP